MVNMLIAYAVDHTNSKKNTRKNNIRGGLSSKLKITHNNENIREFELKLL